MHLGLSQNIRMDQRLVQSPQMIQAMQILQLSSLDLMERIDQELLENPFLEVEEKTAETPDSGAPAEPEADPEQREADNALDTMMETLERYEKDFGDGRQAPNTSGEDGDRKLEAMQNTAASYQSLGDVLMTQVALSDLPPRRRHITEFIVYSLDHRGFLSESLEDILDAFHRERLRGKDPSQDEGVTLDDFELCLEDLRAATHPALGAADLKECLLLQVDAGSLGNYDVDFIRTLISQHIENIVANRLPRIARATTHSLEEVKIGIEAIRTLDPWPGREYGQEPAETIHPDVIVEEFESEFQVRLTREGLKDLSISSTYRRILKEAAKGDSAREWIKKRLESARWFIDALEQRQSTLERIARIVFRHQEAFLRKGVGALAPLRMQEVADEVGVHISTVSRAVAGKYVQTPHGILPLRFFFTGGMEKDSGGMTSQASIKERIKQLIDKEDKASPLSDERLADMLHEKDGLSIARRTVTKYRKAMQIPSSSQRREY